MDKQKILNLFVKAEKQLADTFGELNSQTADAGKSLGQIQQTSYFLEKMNASLFDKIVKDCRTQLQQLRIDYPQIRNIKSPEVTAAGLKFKFNDQDYIAPLLPLRLVVNQMGIKGEDFSGKFVQVSYLLRPENYLDLCLINFFWGKNA